MQRFGAEALGRLRSLGSSARSGASCTSTLVVVPACAARQAGVTGSASGNEALREFPYAYAPLPPGGGYSFGPPPQRDRTNGFAVAGLRGGETRARSGAPPADSHRRFLRWLARCHPGPGQVGLEQDEAIAGLDAGLLV